MSGHRGDAEGLFRFALWANGCLDRGRHLTPEQVQEHTGKSRAQSYRLLAAYFSAQGWYWGRDRTTAPISKPQAAGGEHPWITDRRMDMENRRAVAA